MPDDLALAHLLLRMRPLMRALRVAVALRDAHAHHLREAGAAALTITRGHADALLDELSDLSARRALSSGEAALLPDEVEAEVALRARGPLPLDGFVAQLGLDPFECEVLVLCASVELDSEFERVLAYVQDDAARRLVSVELAAALTATSLRERVARRAALGPYGRLRRLGLVTATSRETGLRDELRLAPPCIAALLGTPLDLRAVFRDPAAVELERPTYVAADPGLLARAADALRERRLGAVGVWGPKRSTRDIVAALADAIGAPVRRIASNDPDAAVAVASALGALLWIDLDAVGEPVPAELLDACRRTEVPLILTGVQPWRPTELLAARAFAEITARVPDHRVRSVLWQAALPELAPQDTEHLARSFHFDATEVAAAERMAHATAELQTNGHAVTAADCLPAVCVAVARKHGERHTTLVVPRRGAEDLVLPPDLHVRVLDVVHNFRALPRVMSDWGFARRTSGGGIKALFTGEPGTGKTLAAEVIAKELGLPMLKVDLARVVSKWIGETEKNLDLVFTEAHDSHAVLFFDEAEALFGARGDVRHGTDRYANLEVSYLLQRLEDHAGVVVLATNLRDKIDPAFMRRFHAVIGFPRPSEKERRRMWQRVFTPEIPLAGDLDVPLLARFDLTGAGIVGAAQTAALLAAREDAPVAMRHVVHGLVRQFQREARVLSRTDLGAHAVHAGPS